MTKAKNKTHPSSFRDLEKNMPYERKKPKTNTELLGILLLVIVVGTILNIAMFNSNSRKNAGDFEPGQGNSPTRKILSQSGIDVSDASVSLLDLKNLEEKQAFEWENYVNEAKQHNAEPKEPDFDDFDDDFHSKTTNPQADLKEILSVNSIVLLTTNEIVEQQDDALRILSKVKVHPEIKYVNLAKHPHYQDILAYLKKFSLKKGFRETYSDYSKTIVNNPDSDTEFDIYDDDKDIPRLFIGGMPVADYGDIITKHKNNELQSFLREAGKGSINISID